MARSIATMTYLQQLPDKATAQQVHRVVGAVVGLGGSVGWLEVPTFAEVKDWLLEWQLASATGRAGLLLARVGDRIEALGGWRAGPPGPVGHVVELTKIMTHPDSTGLGLGRQVVTTLCNDAAAHGAELLVLGVRGNNQDAIALYESCGFTVWGVLPNGVAVGADRWDDVRMCRQIALPDAAISHGTTPGGLGGSLRREPRNPDDNPVR